MAVVEDERRAILFSSHNTPRTSSRSASFLAPGISAAVLTGVTVIVGGLAILRLARVVPFAAMPEYIPRLDS